MRRLWGKFLTTFSCLAVSFFLLEGCASTKTVAPTPGERGLSTGSGRAGLSMEDLKPRLAQVLRCAWIDSENETSLCRRDGSFDYELRQANGMFLLEGHYINPDYQHSAGEATSVRERLIVMVTTLLPDWKDARAWLTACMDSSQVSYIDKSSVQIKELWVVVEHVGGNVSENGATRVYVTDDPRALPAIED